MANLELKILVDSSAPRTLAALVRRKLNETLAPLMVSPIDARVAFVDDNGPRHGAANRCALTVRLPYRPTIRVDHTADSDRTAFDGALATLERRLVRYREMARDARRHPKKYFAADAVLRGAVAPPTRAARARRRGTA